MKWAWTSILLSNGILRALSERGKRGWSRCRSRAILFSPTQRVRAELGPSPVRVSGVQEEKSPESLSTYVLPTYIFQDAVPHLSMWDFAGNGANPAAPFSLLSSGRGAKCFAGPILRLPRAWLTR